MPRFGYRSNLERYRNHCRQRRQYRQLTRIIDRYARTDSRIVAIHKANEGLAYARKSGIEAAHGKYVQHLDGDDFLEPDACELLFNRAEETNADIVIMRFLIDSPCGQEEPPFWTQDEYNNISAIHTMAHEDYRWNLVFLFQRRDLHAVPIDYLQNLTYGEDAYQSIQIAYRSKKIVTLRDKPLYHYVVRKSSVTQTGMTRKKAENVLLFPNLIETFLEGTPENRQFAEDIVYIRFRAYFLLLLKNWREGMAERCRFMAESLTKYPALEQLEEVRRFTKLIRLYTFSLVGKALYGLLHTQRKNQSLIIETMPAVSIIIPVYNIGKYLEKCLDSVIAQTFPDIEIIVVNDGSTDNSPEIIARYADKDSPYRRYRQS